MRNRFRNKRARTRRRTEAPFRQAAYDALTPQQKFDKAVAVGFMTSTRNRREVERLINGPHGAEIKT